MNIVYVKGTPYAVDLWWQVRAGGVAPRTAMLQAARETARELNESYTCVALRPQQYGLGLWPIAVPNIPSLAAALRPQIHVNKGFLGVFCLNNTDAPTWWVCGISRGAVAAAGDRIFETEEAALAHVRQLRDLFGASEEVVQTTPESSETYLLPLLADDARVEPLFPDPNRRQGLLRMAVIAMVLLLICIGGKWLWDSKTQKTAVKHARELMQSKESRRREILANPGNYFQRAWLDAPTVMVMSEQCLAELFAVPLSRDGWVLDAAICRPGSLLTTWNHRPGASYTHLPFEARLENPKKAVAQHKLASLTPRGADAAALVTREEIVSRLYETTRILHCRLKVNWAAPEKILVDDVEIRAPWLHGAWQMDAIPSLLLTDGLSLLATVPGVFVSEIIFDKSWTVKGGVYANSK